MSCRTATNLNIHTRERAPGYSSELCRSMSLLAEDERTVFLGQGVRYPGTFMSTTLLHLPEEKRIEMPVAEEMQLAISIGMALDGKIPITVYPRWNFLLLAANQLVNHMDKMKAHVIVRVGVGSERPLWPGWQHVGDFTGAFRQMCHNTQIWEIKHPESIVKTYLAALAFKGPSIIVEWADMYE